MRSVTEDRPASAIIRDRALELFAAHGASAVTVRQIATAAGVSPALVIHHFGSKEGLERAVEREAVALFEDLLVELERDDHGAASLAGLFADRLEAVPALAGYVSRLLCEDGRAGDILFARLFDTTRRGMRALVDAGIVRPAADEKVRSAVLLANDLAVLLLRSRIEAATGADPLSRSGLERWSGEVFDIYTGGIFAGVPSGGDAGGPVAPGAR